MHIGYLRTFALLLHVRATAQVHRGPEPAAAGRDQSGEA
jgi:hypothetical protein